MVIKTPQGNAIQEAAQVVTRYEAGQVYTQSWSCEVCGMIYSGSTPAACDSCGIANAFVSQETRNEIGSRW